MQMAGFHIAQSHLGHLLLFLGIEFIYANSNYLIASQLLVK